LLWANARVAGVLLAVDVPPAAGVLLAVAVPPAAGVLAKTVLWADATDGGGEEDEVLDDSPHAASIIVNAKKLKRRRAFLEDMGLSRGLGVQDRFFRERPAARSHLKSSWPL
jgi:hypothetical protein